MINKRQQLPPQIRKITVADRSSGKPVVRYQVTVDAGFSPETGKRRQIRRRFATEREARAELSQTQGGMSAGTYVHASKLTVEQACEAWLASKHSLKPSTLRGHRVSLQPLRDELGTVEVQRLSKANVDDLIARLRRGEVEGRRAWSARSCNYLRYLTSVVLDDQRKQGNVVRNVAELVDRVDGGAKTFRTLTDAEMFRILDHECRDRHLWALALYGLRRGEIAGLRWANVNLTDKTMVTAQTHYRRGQCVSRRTAWPSASRSRRGRRSPRRATARCRCLMRSWTCSRRHVSDRPKSGCALVRATGRASTWPATSRACRITRTC